MTRSLPALLWRPIAWSTVGLSFLIVALLLGLGPRPVQAQQADSTQLRRFQRANAYLQSGRDEQAIEVLEQLYAESPGNTTFYRKLKEAYEGVKRYDDALRLVDRRMDGDPTVSLLSEKARLLYLKGDAQKADETWEQAVRLAPRDIETYRTVYQTLIDLRYFRKAIGILQQGRETLDRSAAFRTELAYLYGLDGQFEKAMREYVELLANAPRRANYVQRRLRTFVEQDRGISASIKVLRGAVRDAPLNPAYRQLLAWLYMEQDDYAAAFDVYRAIDRLQDQQGSSLFQFAKKAADAQQFAVATQACEAILERHPESTVAPNTQKMLGNLYRHWAAASPDSTTAAQDSARYDRARSAYNTFLREYSGHEDYPTVLLRLGTLQLDVYHALDDAQATFEQVTSNHPQTAAAEKAQYHRARVSLFRGQLQRARLLLSRLANNAQDSDLAGRARYELALLYFYRGEFDAATARAEATSKNPATDVANDAIELKTLIQENQGPDSLNTALQTFAKARLYNRQRAFGKALTALDSLARAHPQHSLADNARFLRGHIHLARRDTVAALVASGSVPERHPRSPYADRSLFRAGKLLESTDRPIAAVEVYNRLLTEYPKSLLASDARNRLRFLQRAQG